MPDISDLIAQGVKPPQVEDLGTAFARSKATQYTLGNMALQQTRARQEISEGAITLQRAEKQQDEDRAIDNAFAQFTAPGPDGKPKIDRDGLITHLTTTGRGIAAQRVQAQFDASDLAKAKSMEAQTDLQIKNLDLTGKRAGELAKLAQVVKDAPPEGKQDAYQNLHREGLRLGLISPQMQAQFPELYDPSQDPHLDAMILGAQDAKTRSELQTADLTRNKDQAELDKTRATTAETWRVTAATQAANALSQQDLDGIRARLASQGAPPAALAAIPAMWSQTAMQQLARSARTSEQNAQLDQQAATLAQTKVRDENTAKNEAATRNQGQQRINIERENSDIKRVEADPFGALGLNRNPVGAGSGANLHGAEFLKTLPPPMAARVLAVSEGRETRNARDKMWPAIQTAVEQYDPTWSEQRSQLRKAFTTGPDGRNIGNLNTAVVHLDQLHEAAKAMNNGTWQPGNRLYNYFVTQFGGADPTNYNAVMTAFAGEAASALKGNATDPEISHVMSSLVANMAPKQAEGVALANLHVLGTKINTYQERYHAMAPDDPWTPVLPSAREVFNRYGIDPTARPGAAPASGNRPALDSFWKK